MPEQKLNAWLTGDNECNYIHRVACFNDVHEGGAARIQISNIKHWQQQVRSTEVANRLVKPLLLEFVQAVLLEYIKEDITQ